MLTKFIKFIAILAFSGVVFASAQTDNAVELRQILQATTSLQADFTQVVYDAKDRIVSKASGHMVVKKPKLFRWQVKTPEPSLIIVDGKKFWNYDEELQQVTVQDMDKNYASSPVGLFLAADINDIRKQYIVNKITSDALKPDKVHFELVPRKAADGFKKVDLIFKANIIDSLILVDQLDQVSNIKFTNVQTNSNVSETLFVFIPPVGVDVIGEIVEHHKPKK